MRKQIELRPVFGGMALCAVLILTVSGTVGAQQATGGGQQATVGGQGAPPAADSAQPFLENLGKPMALPFRCTDDDIQWAGMSCSEEDPCPVYLEVTAAEGVGSQIFATGNLHADTVTLYSVLLRSEDAGKSWREGFERIRGAGLDHIQFSDFANGWASGETLFPLPQDPFLLITADGGKTWRRQPIFEDPHPGSIQQFFFSSKDEGSLIVDQGEGSGSERYTLYESPNGGGTWMVRQIGGKPLKLPHGPDAAEGWRVQADRATRAFRLERRQGEHWATAASFAVSAGSCKPAALEAKPPEDASPEPARPRR